MSAQRVDYLRQNGTFCLRRIVPSARLPVRTESATCLDRLRELGDLGFSGVERAGLLASRLPSPVGVFWLTNGLRPALLTR